MQGIKHLIECHCVLPQFRDRRVPLYHSFVAFSILDDDDNVIPKYSQCNNCGVIHRVIDVTKSEVALGNDNAAAVVSIDDLRHSVPESVANVLDSYGVDVATWEETVFLIENAMWGSTVTLVSDESGDEIHGKQLRFMRNMQFKIEPFIRTLTLS